MLDKKNSDLCNNRPEAWDPFLSWRSRRSHRTVFGIPISGEGPLLILANEMGTKGTKKEEEGKKTEEQKGRGTFLLSRKVRLGKVTSRVPHLE